MEIDTQNGASTNGEDHTKKLDALIVGAGAAGLYQLFLLKNQGLKVRAYDKASPADGTRCWNRVAGTKFDSESYIYHYLFSEQQCWDWNWGGHLPREAEFQMWMTSVIDFLDLREDIQFETKITNAHYNEDTKRWAVEVDRGEAIDTQFLITCCGLPSAPPDDVCPGQDNLKSEIIDAGEGAFTRIDIRGRGGRSLTEDWCDEIRTTMGLQVHGYPNLFTTAVPLAPSVALCNMTNYLRQQAEWINDCILFMRSQNSTVIEPTAAMEDDWVANQEESAGAIQVSTANGWHLGSNLPGKSRCVLSYTGAAGTYRAKCEAVAQSGYLGFEIR